MKRLFVLLTLSLLLLTACSPGSATDTAGNDIATYADPLADHVISGIINRDYATFSQDFDSAMQSGIPESSFQEILTLFDTRVGKCSTYDLTQTGMTEEFPYAMYTLQCENSKKGVFIRIVITPDEPHQVTGLWFDAAEMR